MIRLLLHKRKKSQRDLIRSLSEGKLSVQNIFFVSMLASAAFLIDGMAYVYFSSRTVDLVRLLLCMAVVYNWPLPWIYVVSALIIATVSYQAAGQELLLCCFIITLLDYSKLRMVNTDFSRHVLVTAGYVLFEFSSYFVIHDVSAKEVVSHFTVVVMLFLLYTFSRRVSDSDRVI